MDFTCGFHFNTHKEQAKIHECTVEINEILSVVKKQNKKWKDLSYDKVHVLSASVQGHNAQTPIKIKIKDDASREFTNFIPMKRQQDGMGKGVQTVGAPLFPNSPEGKLIYECSEPLTEDQMRFGDLSTEAITSGVQHISLSGHKYALIPKQPNGVYFYWALTVQNKVFADNVCESPKTRYAEDSSVFKLDFQTYTGVVKAYKQKIDAQQFHNFGSITVTINSLCEEKLLTQHPTVIFINFNGLFQPKTKTLSTKTQSSSAPSRRDKDSDEESDYTTDYSGSDEDDF